MGLVVSLREVVELSESRKTMRDDLSAIKEILTGDRDPSRGLVVRVDRLEQQAQSNHWFVDKVLNAIIAALVAAGFTWFGPHR